MNRWLKPLGLLCASLFAIVGLAELRLFCMQQYLATRRYEDLYVVPDNRWLSPLSLGYKETLADMLWIKGLIYFGEEVRHKSNSVHIYDYSNAILTLDENFKAVYRWVGTSAIYRTGTVTVNDVKRAISFLKRGADRFPDDGELAWDLGATLRFELVPLLKNEHEKREAKRQAIDYMLAAARMGKGPPWLVLTNVSELKQLGATTQAIRHLEEMYATVNDDDTRQQIAMQLAGLRDKAYRDALKQANDQLARRHQTQWPYLPTNLHILLGEAQTFPTINLKTGVFGHHATSLEESDTD